MSHETLSRQRAVETLFRAYEDLPREVVLKEDILNEGIAVSNALTGAHLGKDLAIEGGIYALQRTVFDLRICQESPYLLDSIGGDLVLLDREYNQPLAPARWFPDASSYAGRRRSDGSLCQDIVEPDGELRVFSGCQLGESQRCKFCGLERKAPTLNRASIASVEAVAEATAELLVTAEWDPREKPAHIKLTGGTINGELDGKDEEAFYRQYVGPIKSVVRDRYPLMLEMFPQPAALEISLWREGVNARISSLDFWDKELFAALCPGKEAAVGWEEWVRRLIDQVGIFGQGHVLPSLIVGIEMVKPWGQRSPRETVETAAKAFQFLMLHGVTPRPVHPWLGSSIARGQIPPVELFLEIDRVWYETWQKYAMYEPAGHRMGPGRNRFSQSAACDVGRGSPLMAVNLGPRDS